MQKALVVLAMLVALLAGCGGVVQHASKSIDDQRKTFLAPADKSAIYIFRNGFLGHKLNTEVFIDGKILGKNLGYTYLYVEVPEGKHTITSHFTGYTTLEIETKRGELYFVNEIFDIDLISNNLILEQVETLKGKKGVLSCKLAESAL